MLTGETKDTLKPGRRVDAVALRVFATEVICQVRAESCGCPTFPHLAGVHAPWSFSFTAIDPPYQCHLLGAAEVAVTCQRCVVRCVV